MKTAFGSWNMQLNDTHCSLEKQYNSLQQKNCDMRPGQQSPVCRNVAILIVDYAKVCQIRGISPPHNTMNKLTSKHFTKSHTRPPLSHCSHKMEIGTMADWQTLTLRKFRSAQQDTTMSLMYEYFTTTCPVTIPTHLYKVHPLCL